MKRSVAEAGVASSYLRDRTAFARLTSDLGAADGTPFFRNGYIIPAADSAPLSTSNCPSYPALFRPFSIGARAEEPVPQASDILGNIQYIHGYDWAHFLAMAEIAGLDRYETLSESEKDYVDEVMVVVHKLKQSIVDVQGEINLGNALDALARQQEPIRQARFKERVRQFYQHELARLRNGQR
ncbi:hypothetical protein A4X06_0g1345 [Tilletia controversa]|uniref:Uncharacterized protein n=3 Tax=Tilletia TaxID=13289 RepID=A0A8X7MYI7_9BASI|nr:hypothetical protein CF336_g4947 [Tilletia laevis]KAE8194970.1 hypothetical protein CF328_g4585 [Tilletia controversa]KAE8197564.1 hypothetical protein CF335_g4581 [Tilletia laevis]KAE8251636.1 hypothetical protein A4X03_0g6340 [Tilletia caries]KAE8253590.1 hypothetical protein A4X06_0g1345 [Tilletia controversa]